jgi:alkylhydroperoxidase family enzyme
MKTETTWGKLGLLNVSTGDTLCPCPEFHQNPGPTMIQYKLAKNQPRFFLSLLTLGMLMPLPDLSFAESGEQKACVSVLSDDEAWARLPKATLGAGQALPVWARAVAVHLPRTAAAMLELDYAHRVKSPIDPVLRAKMRWVIADANHCEYSRKYAIADMKRSGASDKAIAVLTGDPEMWPESDRKPLEFARLLTIAAPTIPDALFEDLRVAYGEQQVASMVLLGAYGNFQDRMVLGLQLPMEESEPLAPLDVEFEDGALQIASLLPASVDFPKLQSTGEDVIEDDEDWGSLSYDQLQERLDKQRERQPRLPVPTWDEVKGKLPPAMATRPTRIVWSLMTYGYAAELQIPWSIATRTMWAERPGDRVFEESLFWIQTRTIECNYCMGHCEMLLEVAGLDKKAIAERTSRLASNDWSSFPPEEQRAYAYARKLSKAPWTLTSADYATLKEDFGEAQAMSTFWWLCRGLYMTRISDGFQLPLEKENVFGEMPRK